MDRMYTQRNASGDETKKESHDLERREGGQEGLSGGGEKAGHGDLGDPLVEKEPRLLLFGSLRKESLEGFISSERCCVSVAALNADDLMIILLCYFSG